MEMINKINEIIVTVEFVVAALNEGHMRLEQFDSTYRRRRGGMVGAAPRTSYALYHSERAVSSSVDVPVRVMQALLAGGLIKASPVKSISRFMSSTEYTLAHEHKQLVCAYEAFDTACERLRDRGAIVQVAHCEVPGKLARIFYRVPVK